MMWRLLVLLMICGPASAGTLDEILARGTVRVGMTGDYRPFSIKDETGHFEGLDVDMAESLAKGLGVKLEIVPTAWANLITDIKADRFDIGMGGITITLDRAKSALFSAPLMRTGKTPIARCADQAKYATLADIDRPGVHVITNPGGTNERYARANLHQADIVVFPSNATIFDEIAASRADVMITDAVETRVQHRLHPDLCGIHPDAPFDFSELGYMLPRDPALQAWVNQWLHLSAETGETRRLEDKWLN